MKNKTKQFLSLLAVAGILTFQSCKKEDDNRVPPTIKFVTGSSLISADATLPKDTTVSVGIIVGKTEDELRTFNVSYAYDNAASTTTLSNESITGAEVNGFTRTVQVTTRTQAGTEKYVFTTTDKDGNVASVKLIFTVQ